MAYSLSRSSSELQGKVVLGTNYVKWKTSEFPSGGLVGFEQIQGG